jgi:hypothetical protein
MSEQLTDLQRRVLVAMRELEKDDRRSMPNRHGFTPNEIGSKARAKRVNATRHRFRNMGAAQQIIFPLTSLERRGLVRHTERDDGLSGSAYRLTDAGREAL